MIVITSVSCCSPSGGRSSPQSRPAKSPCLAPIQYQALLCVYPQTGHPTRGCITRPVIPHGVVTPDRPPYTGLYPQIVSKFPTELPTHRSSCTGLYPQTAGTVGLYRTSESNMKRELNQNLSGNEVYYTACSLQVM